MIINFKVKDFDKYMCMYGNIWHVEGGGTLTLDDDAKIEVWAYRIVVPVANLSLRLGYLYHKHDIDELELDGDEDEWALSCDLFVAYDRDEKDWNNWICTQGNDFEWAIKEYIEENQGLKNVDVNDFDCYVDTSEFIEDEAEAERLAAEDIKYYNENCKEEFEGDEE